MTASNRHILRMLFWYREKMKELLGQEDITIASEYSFITINNEIRFEVSDQSATVDSVSADLKNKLAALQWPGLNSTYNELPWTKDVTQQLETADSIASLATNCTTGDDYEPGNFSRILLTNRYIELQQINYMNSRSIDHKNDYSLRSLIFRISLNETVKMRTEFTDHSSENKRQCGDRIKTALDQMPG